MKNDILEGLNTRVDDEFDKKYGRAKSKGSSKIMAKLQLASNIKVKLNRRRMRNYGEIYEEARDNVEAALEVEKKLQTSQLTDAQRASLKEKRADYVDAVSENSEEAARIVDKALKSSGYYSKNRVYKFISRHPFVFKLDDRGNKKLKLQKNILLRITTKLIPRYRKYEASKREGIRDQVMDRFDNLVAIHDDKLVESQGGLDQLSKKSVVRTLAATLEDDRNVVPNLKTVKFEEASAPQTTPTASTMPTAPNPAISQTPSPKDFVAAMGKKQMEDNDLKKTVADLTAHVKELNQKLGAVMDENAQLKRENEALRNGAYSAATPVAPVSPSVTDGMDMIMPNNSTDVPVKRQNR